MYIEAIKAGLDGATRNWQAALIRLVFLAFSIIGALIIIGTTFISAWFMLGINLNISDFTNIESLLSLLFTKYLGLLLILIIMLLMYSLIIITLALFIYGGTAGVTILAINDPNYRFKMGDFISVAKKTFFPLMWYTTLISVIGLGILFIFGLDTWLTYTIIESASNYSGIKIFSILVTSILNISLIGVFMALTFYGIADIYINSNKSARQSVKSAFTFIANRPSSIWFIFIVGLFFTLGNGIFILIGLIMSKLPTIGIYIAFPFELLIYFIQSLLSIALTGSIFYYFGHMRNLTEANEATEITPAIELEISEITKATPAIDMSDIEIEKSQ